MRIGESGCFSGLFYDTAGNRPAAGGGIGKGQWIRWRSLRPDVPHWGIGDEVTGDGIRFEICESVPSLFVEDTRRIFQELQGSPMSPGDECTEWIEEARRELSLPLVFKLKGPNGPLPYIQACGWPDVTLELESGRDFTPEEESLADDILTQFLIKCEKKGCPLHFAERTSSGGQNPCVIQLDFGEGDPSVLRTLVNQFAKSGLPLTAVCAV